MGGKLRWSRRISPERVSGTSKMRTHWPYLVEPVRHISLVATLEVQFENWSTARGIKIGSKATVFIFGSETEHFPAERVVGLSLVSHSLVVGVDSEKVRTVPVFGLLGDVMGVE
jgi:hypothetical protein